MRLFFLTFFSLGKPQVGNGQGCIQRELQLPVGLGIGSDRQMHF